MWLIMLTRGKTHKQPATTFPTIAGNMSMCLRGVGTIAAEHSSPKHISTEQTVDQVPQKETQLGRNRYGKPGW